MKINNYKKTQGQAKAMRYLEELSRNRQFRKDIKGLVHKHLEGKYKDWTPKEQKKHDEINGEYSLLIKYYEILRKRANKKLLNDRDFIRRKQVASAYGLDAYLLGAAISMIEKDSFEWEEYFSEEIDMCKLANLYDEQLAPANKGEEIIHLMPHRQLRTMAYPVAICINQRASKRDVLDFIEKRWGWIESNLRQFEDQKALKFRKRKYKQEILDFIWDNRFLSSAKLKKKLDKKHPKNGLVYFELNKIIQLEKERRLKDLT